MNLSLRGTIVYRTGDALGDILVIDHGKHRILSFDSVFEQSKIKRLRPHVPVHEYNRAMLLPLAWHEPRHATVLGLGGGVLLGALHTMLPACELHAVELRGEVVAVAREYFSLPQGHNIRITVSDARPALRELVPGSTDLILADMYGADHMSPAQSQRRFIDQCLHALSESGWLAINYHRSPQDGPLFQHIRRCFASVFMFKSKTNNYVLYASVQPVAPITREAPRLKDLQKRLPIDWTGLAGRITPMN